MEIQSSRVIFLFDEISHSRFLSPSAIFQQLFLQDQEITDFSYVCRKIPPIGNWRPPYLISIAFPVTFLMTRPHDVSFFFFFFLVTEKHNGINIVLV